MAAAYLLAGQEDINGTANGGTGLPGGFEFAYFTSCDASGQTCAQPWPSGYDEPNRQAALAQALNGVVRMETGLVPSLFALLQAFIFLALALAAAILFFSLPLSLVFAFFNTTEIIALAVVRAYIGLLVKTYVTATILALFMGFLLGWGEGNWVAFLGMSLPTVFFTWQLARASVQTITQSLNVVTQAIGQATGTQWSYVDPPQLAGQAVGLGASVALAAATGGTGLAVGSLVSGVGGALGLPGASTLGTAIALGYRRRGGSEGAMAAPRRDPFSDPTVPPPHEVSGSRSPAVEGTVEPPAADSAAVDPEALPAVIDGEWYEVRDAQVRRTRANRWLIAQGIPPVPEAARPGTLLSSEAHPPGWPVSLRFDPPAWTTLRPLRTVGDDGGGPSPEDIIPVAHPILLPTRVPPTAAVPLALPATVTPAAESPVPVGRAEPDVLPAALQTQAQWVAWRSENVHGRSTKIPYDPRSGRRARSNDPATWGTVAEAQAALVQGGYDGLGFMLRADDPFVGVDLDHCFDPQTGTLLPWAAAVVQTLDSYTEVSPSGTGIRIFAQGSLPPRELGRREGPIEMYSERRFLSVTGQHLAGTPATIEDRAGALEQLHQQVFQRRYATAQAATAPSPPPTGRVVKLSDDTILTKIQKAKNGLTFERLWQGDIAGYASASEADLALCGMLAFYTQDPTQIERLVEQSGLWDEKWRNRPAYRAATIQQAIAHRSGTYTGRRVGDRDRGRPSTPPVNAPVAAISEAEHAESRNQE